MLIMTVPTGAAHGGHAYVAVAGECTDGGGSSGSGLTDGGSDDARARAHAGTNPTVEVDVLSGTGTANAVLQLAEGAAGEGNPPSNNCDSGGPGTCSNYLQYTGAVDTDGDGTREVEVEAAYDGSLNDGCPEDADGSGWTVSQ